MIKSIGIQKIAFILFLTFLAVGGYFYNTKILTRDIIMTERKARSVQANLNKMTADTEKLIQGVELFNEQKAEFITVQKSGFFDDQDRVITKKRLDEIQLATRLKTFRYNISPAIDVTSSKLNEAGYKMLSTSIELDLGAIDDTDIFKFLYLFNHGFPGQIIISNITMEKEQNITQPLLRNIGLKGSFQPLVSSKVIAKWFTMVPKNTESKNNEAF